MPWTILLNLGLTALVVCLSWTNAIQYVTVTTNVGEIEGFQDMVRIDDGMYPVFKYLGIPYAESAAGNNRFEKPIPKAPFKTKYPALSYPPFCYQVTTKDWVLSEDCLYLNIYVPNNTQSSPLPVMIYIHGGAFEVGSGRLQKGDALSVFGNVIVVTINYRLEMFGFLGSKDGTFIGNQGLWDQHLAIKWVHDNIAAFHGDPNEVTIFGESAGSASVLLQALYPGNEGMFKRVIAESGTALTYWAVTDPKADQVLELTGCKNATDPLFCLRLLAPLDLQTKAQVYNRQPIQYSPSVDNDFLMENPHDIIYGNNSISDKARSFFASLDIITGINNFDGVLYLRIVWPAVLNETFPDIHVSRDKFLNLVIPLTVQSVLKPKCRKVAERLARAVAFEYTDWSDPGNDTKRREKLIDLSSDVAFFTSAVNTVQGHFMMKQGKTYLYEFALELTQHKLPTPSYVIGSNHADDIAFVFGYPVSNAYLSNRTYTDQQKTVSRAMMSMWTNFAKTSDPNKPLDVQQYVGSSWPEYTLTSQDYLQFTAIPNTNKVKQSFQASRMAFWLNYIPSIILNTPCV